METHEVAAAKQAENSNMMKALGINPSTYKEGFAFDREGQAELAAAEREAKENKRREAELRRKIDEEGRAKMVQEIERVKREGVEKLKRAEEEMRLEKVRQEKAQEIGELTSFSSFC